MSQKDKNSPLEDRKRVFNCLLYPDCPEHKKAIKELTDGLKYSCVGILHDKDFYTEDCEEHAAGELKKAHYHFVIRFTEARTRSAISKELGVDKRALEPTQSFKGSVLYLLHRGHPDKHQYSADELIGSLRSKALKLLDDRTEDETAQDVIKLLNSQKGYCPYSVFVNLCCERGLYGTLRRGGNLFIRAIEEHNSRYKEGVL